MDLGKRVTVSRRNWFSDPLVESDSEYVVLDSPSLSVDSPAAVLFDCEERPLRRQIGFRPSSALMKMAKGA
jgi:hypothetical protein